MLSWYRASYFFGIFFFLVTRIELYLYTTIMAHAEMINTPAAKHEEIIITVLFSLYME